MNTGIEHELRAAVERRCRPNLDDIDAKEILQALAERSEQTARLKQALKTLLCDTEESECMTGREREIAARALLVELGE